MKWRLWIVLMLALGCDNATAESITEATVERTVEVGRGIGSGISAFALLILTRRRRGLPAPASPGAGAPLG